jgi:purine-binding chemotaxis protein CheW
MTHNHFNTPANINTPLETSDPLDYVTIYVGDQLFGLPILRVQDVFSVTQMTHVPLAPRQVVGLLNLRGRVVTALSLRERLGMGVTAEAGDSSAMAVGIEHGGEPFALMVDKVGEVMRLTPATYEPNPVHMSAAWVGLSKGVHRLQDRLLIILDIDSVLNFDAQAAA